MILHFFLSSLNGLHPVVVLRAGELNDTRSFFFAGEMANTRRICLLLLLGFVTVATADPFIGRLGKTFLNIVYGDEL